MEPPFNTPYCPLPQETNSDMIPLAVVIGVFVLVGWLLRRRRKKRKTKH